MRKRRILYVISTLHEVGGGEKSPCTTACHLAKDFGYEVLVAYVWQNKPGRKVQMKAVDLKLDEHLEAHGVRHAWMGKVHESGLWTIPVAIRSLRRIVADFKPDLIHSHCMHPDFYAFLQRRPCIRVRTIHSMRYYVKHPSLDPLAERVLRQRFHKSVFVCQTLADLWRKKHGLQPEAGVVVPNPIGRCFFENVRVRTEAPTPPYKLGLVGRLSEPKGHDTAMEALDPLAAELPITLYLAGDGELRTQLERQAADLQHLRVHFVGALDEAGVRKFYDEMDLLLAPSRWEGFNLTAYEGPATGLPLVGTAVCGVVDILTAMGSKPVAVGNKDALRAAVRKTLGDETLYRQLSEAGIQATKHCDSHQVAAAHDALYLELFAARGKVADAHFTAA